MPDKVRDILSDNDYQIHLPEEGDWETEQPYEHLRRGRCMACGGKLEEQTVLLMDGSGVLGMWDMPQCLADIHAISFLREVEGAIVSRVEARGDGA